MSQVLDLTNRLVVVTGASSGIGLAAAEAMARRGAQLVLVGRDQARLGTAVERVGRAGGRAPAAYRADFSRLDDVHVLIDHLRQRYRRIDVLANNGGGLVKGRGPTADGFDPTLQVNHLAPFLITHLLREQLRGGRMMVTASGAHTSGALDPGNLTSTPSTWKAYAAAKQANILFAREAARRWPDIMCTSFHPGMVRTRFAAGTVLAPAFRFIPWLKTPEQGADTLVWLAATPHPKVTPGGYYVKRSLTTPAAQAADPALAIRLWDASVAAVFR